MKENGISPDGSYPFLGKAIRYEQLMAGEELKKRIEIHGDGLRRQVEQIWKALILQRVEDADLLVSDWDILNYIDLHRMKSEALACKDCNVSEDELSVYQILILQDEQEITYGKVRELVEKLDKKRYWIMPQK